MRYLLDTHILLWALQNSPKLSKQAKDIITNLPIQIMNYGLALPVFGKLPLNLAAVK